MFTAQTGAAIYNEMVLRNLENVHYIFKVGLLNMNFDNNCSIGI